MIEVPGAGHLAAWSGDAKAVALRALREWTEADSPNDARK
jgi:hypothetical protein